MTLTNANTKTRSYKLSESLRRIGLANQVFHTSAGGGLHDWRIQIELSKKRRLSCIFYRSFTPPYLYDRILLCSDGKCEITKALLDKIKDKLCLLIKKVEDGASESFFSNTVRIFLEGSPLQVSAEWRIETMKLSDFFEEK